MTDVWLTIAVLSLGTVALKATGPLVLGGREPGERTFAVISLFAPALLAALVVYETLTSGHQTGITIDARLAGLAAAALALVARLPLRAVVLGAAATTAVVRALGG